jgi:uncharacterized protein YegP (UPF0339 family)
MGKYEVKKSEAGYHFHLKAGNGEIIGSSEVYNSKDACMNGINSVRTNGPAAEIEDQTEEGFKTEMNPKYVVKRDKAGKYRFNLTAKNGQIILSSQEYKEADSCMNGIESVKKNAAASEIIMVE